MPPRRQKPMRPSRRLKLNIKTNCFGLTDGGSSAARLAAQQNPADAAVTYEQLFRLAIAGNLFRDAEPAAKALLERGNPSRTSTALRIWSRSSRRLIGARSTSRLKACNTPSRNEKRPFGNERPAQASTRAKSSAFARAYYQRLIHEGQYETARKALQAILAKTERPVLKEFLSSRLKRLEKVGKPAPPLQGTDIDGKPFDLAAAKGKVVLIVFWASWCLPGPAELDLLEQAEEMYGRKGFQIVGIDLDTLPEGGQKQQPALPNVRDFLLEFNVTWPTLINGEEPKDYAKAFGVTEIPANVLIARDGTVAHIDLVPKNFDGMIARAVGQ